MEDDTKLTPFSKQGMKATCDMLGTNLEDDLTGWIEVDMETPVAQLPSEDTAASVKDETATNDLKHKVTQKTNVVIPAKQRYQNQA
jgi:hypothetical protein